MHRRLGYLIRAEVRHTMHDHPEYPSNKRRARQMENSIAKRVIGALRSAFDIELRKARGTDAKDTRA